MQQDRTAELLKAAAHAYAAKSGVYRSLTKWAKDADGNLVGDFELPLSVGIVGGVIQHHPIAKNLYKDTWSF